MNPETLKYQLALTMIPKIGAITAKKLIAYTGSPEGVLTEQPATLRKIPGIGDYLARTINAKDYLPMAEEEMRNMSKYNISSIFYLDPDYPWRLKNCDDGPLLLFFRGKPDFQRTKILSIVGTRSASSYGRDLCKQIVYDLSEKYPDLVIVSGLAYGIDITAHRTALDAGLDTFAVLAHGLHTIYPPPHTSTAFQIIKKGGLLSDFHTTMKPERNNFLRRNRVIAGLSEATLVIESGIKGGALITAEMAASYNREVFAVPGRAIDKYSAGCNYLIKNNMAALIEDARDIEEMLGWSAESKSQDQIQSRQVQLSEKEKLIIATINQDQGIIQEILSVRTKIPLHELTAELLKMELNNWITILPGNRCQSNITA